MDGLNYEHINHDRVITLRAQPQDHKVIMGIAVFLLLFC